MQKMDHGEAEVIAMPGLRSRMAAYQQTTKKKKSSHTSTSQKKKKVGKLQQKLRDPGQFESSKTTPKQPKPVFQVDANVAIEEALQLDTHHEVAELGSEEEPEDTPLTLSPVRRSRNGLNISHVPPGSPSKAVSPRGKSHQQNHNYHHSPQDSPNSGGGGGGGGNGGNGGVLSPNHHRKSANNHHFNHQPTEDELQARSRLNTLLQHEMNDTKAAHSYDVCRVRYLRAVGKLRPVDYYGEGNDSFQSDATPNLDLQKRRREKRKTEKDKKGRYDRLTQSWYSYEDVATDKPVELTPEDEEIEKDLDEIEKEIHEEWEDFAEDVIRAAEEDKEAGLEEEDSDIELWREESRKLKKDAEIRKKRKEDRERKRQEKLEEKRRLEVLEAARRKREEEARLEQEAQEKAEQEARQKAEQEAKQKAEMEAKQKAELEAKQKAEKEEKDRLGKEEQERLEHEENERRRQEEADRIATAAATAATEKESEDEPEDEAKKASNQRRRKHDRKMSNGVNTKENEQPEYDADVDNEDDDEDALLHAKNKMSKHKKKGSPDTTTAEVEETHEMDDEDQDNKQMLNPFAAMGVVAKGENERPKTIKQDSSNRALQVEEDSGTDTSASQSVTDTSAAEGTETGESLAVMTDIALSPKKGRRALGNMEGDKKNTVKYFDEDEEEEDILLPKMNKDTKQQQQQLPKKDKGTTDTPQPDVPPEAAAAENGQKRKKKELRIEYDNGIPKEITIIINLPRNDKKKSKRKNKSAADEDDCSVSDVSESEFSSDESESSESTATENKSLPKKQANDKKTAKQKGKHDAMRIDTLPNQQFYDGTEESPFLAWTHRPLKCKVDGSQISVKVPPRTDCWRKTRHNFIMDNAPFYWHRVNGDFEVMVKVSGDMKKMYDKAGIMIRLDAENWIVSGLEYFNNELNHMTCVTRDYTDWSMAPISPEARTQGAWICIKRIGNAYESFCSMDGRNWRQARQGLFTDAKSVRVGIFCACPMGETFKVTFDKYRCKNLTF